MRVFFRTGQSKFDPAFRQNGKAIDAFIREFHNSQTDPNAEVVVEQVYLSSSASPEGSYSLNEDLARKRQEAILKYLEGRIKIADPNRSTHVIDWARLRSLIDADKDMPEAYREQILEKLNSPDPFSVNSLRGTDAGKYLWDNIYTQMRTSSLVIVWEAWKDLQMPEISHEDANKYIFETEKYAAEDLFDDSLFQPLDASLHVAPDAQYASYKGLILKVNALSLPLLVANIGVEIQPIDHLSVSVPVYYSGLDWFREDIKFRNLTFQPELRYWFKKDFTGLFLNAHATFGWYNVAVGGDFRYQDYQQRTPAFGGGIGVGYKLPLLQKSSRWGLECGLGAGVLPLHYDIYYNVNNGRLAGEDRKTYFGIDQAFVSLTYRLLTLKSKKQ